MYWYSSLVRNTAFIFSNRFPRRPDITSPKRGNEKGKKNPVSQIACAMRKLHAPVHSCSSQALRNQRYSINLCSINLLIQLIRWRYVIIRREVVRDQNTFVCDFCASSFSILFSLSLVTLVFSLFIVVMRPYEIHPTNCQYSPTIDVRPLDRTTRFDWLPSHKIFAEFSPVQYTFFWRSRSLRCVRWSLRTVT